ESEQEYIEIGCHKTDENINEIVSFLKSRQGAVEGTKDDRRYQLPVVDIFYIESVDDRTFIYLERECYESRRKLYEFEEVLASRRFARISKAVIVNLMKIVSIAPALNGRFLCRLTNGESVIISRKYVPEIKEKLKG
ncbi:MAG: LytTR family transcriptional regulator DNA-binding domain-containing protein, partial [Oscillospiraceae bacterium]|nr:LytTR family transcriptional regulator DNA-binding domain-containing protein [Oscillospiraceae bacterium]